MTAPLFDGLLRYNEKQVVPFHMPGHKQGKGIMRADQLKENIFKMDLTEFLDTDNLHDAKGIILEAEKMAAAAFGAKKSFFLVNGTTGGIQAMMMSVLHPGDKVLVERSAHRSVFGGLILTGAIPAYIEPAVDYEDGIPAGVTQQSVGRALSNNTDALAVLITYPNYYGFCTDIKAIADIVHRYGKILLVDEAHGAHFTFNKNLPVTALEAGADMVVQSVHKTLPSFTQSSILHVGSDRIDTGSVEAALRLIETSSPSYLLMASLDLAREEMEDHPEILDKAVDLSYMARDRLAGAGNIRVIGRDIIGKCGIADIDPTKLVVNVRGLNMTGRKVEEVLRDRYNIQVELSDMYNILAMITTGDSEGDIIKLTDAILQLKKDKEDQAISLSFDYKAPEMVFSPREAYFMKKSRVLLKDSTGRTAGDFIIPYPPGIPYVVPGELITEDTCQKLSELALSGIEVVGYDDGYVKILEA